MKGLFVLFVLVVGAIAYDCGEKGKKKVLVIGLDGTKGSVFDPFTSIKENAPNFFSLRNSGKATYCAYNEDPNCARAHSGNRFGATFPATKEDYTSKFEWVTAPGWGSVITGLDNFHTMVANNTIEEQSHFTQVTKTHPTMFMQTKNLGKQTAAAGTPNFMTSGNSNQTIGIIDMECGVKDNGTRPVVNSEDTSSCNLNYRAAQESLDVDRDDLVTQFGVNHIKDGCADLIMTHYDMIDHEGHICGFGNTTCYLNQMSIVDGQVGKMLEAIDEVVKSRDETWLIIVTSDHGGHDTAHNRKWLEDEIVPFILSVKGNEVPELSPLKQPVRHFDVTPTVMYWLNGEEGERMYDGQVQGLL